MNLEVKVRKIGNALGIVLPDAALSFLNIQEGDLVTLNCQQDCILLSSAKAASTKKMEAFKSLSGRYKNTLSNLAKT
jgi:putative addiction module antidote